MRYSRFVVTCMLALAALMIGATLTSGADSVTTRVSVDSSGIQGTAPSSQGVISANGRFVAFMSSASNLIPDDTNERTDVFVHDRLTGATTRVSVNSAGVQGNDDSWYFTDMPAVSDDGRFVAFTSYASNLVAGDTNGAPDVFVRDRDTDGDGVFDEPEAVSTERVSVSSSGEQGNATSAFPDISDDGRFVAFTTLSTNLGGSQGVKIRDRQSATTSWTPGAGDLPAISGSGRFVAYNTTESLVPADTNAANDVYAYDRQSGVVMLVSASSTGTPGNGNSYSAAISWDGRFVAFESQASNLVPGDTNGSLDVFVRDRDTDGDQVFDEPGAVSTERVSISSSGEQGKASRTRPQSTRTDATSPSSRPLRISCRTTQIPARISSSTTARRVSLAWRA
jgi:hypothetical protein